jgi:hypothetical protein
MLALLLALTGFIEGLLFQATLVPLDSFYPIRFEAVVDRCGIPAVFVLALGALVAMDVLGFLQGFMSSKSIYALLTLPLDRRWVYLSKLASSWLTALFLWCFQLLLILAFHGAYAARFAESLPRASLYLSFLRSNFLHTLFPPHPIAAAAALAAIFALVALLQVIIINLKTGRFLKLSLAALACVYPASKLFPLLEHAPEAGLLKLLIALLLVVGCADLGARAFERQGVSA